MSPQGSDSRATAPPGSAVAPAPARSSLHRRLATRAHRRLLLILLAVVVGAATVALVAGVRFPLPALDGCQLVVHDPGSFLRHGGHAVSPDGQFVFFLSTDPRLLPADGVALDGFGYPLAGLFVWDLATRRTQPVRVEAPSPYAGVHYGLPAVARDGRLFAMAAGWHRSERRPLPTVLLVDRVDGSHIEVSTGIAPSEVPGGPVQVSPDGSAVAFVLRREEPNQARVAVWARGEDQLTYVPTGDHGADAPIGFSSDGRTLFFETTTAATTTIRAFDRMSKLDRVLAELPGKGPTMVSPDGTRIVQVMDRSHEHRHVKVRRDGVTIAKIPHAASPAVGDGGRLLAYEDIRSSGLVLFDLDSGRARQPRTTGSGRNMRIRGSSPHVAAESDAVVFVFEKEQPARTPYGADHSIRYFVPRPCPPGISRDQSLSSEMKPRLTTMATTTEMMANPYTI